MQIIPEMPRLMDICRPEATFCPRFEMDFVMGFGWVKVESWVDSVKAPGRTVPAADACVQNPGGVCSSKFPEPGGLDGCYRPFWLYGFELRVAPGARELQSPLPRVAQSH